MKETTDLGIQKIGFIYEYVIKKSHENIAESIFQPIVLLIRTKCQNMCQISVANS